MKQRALVLSGGIEAHEPELIGQRFKNMLEKEGFEFQIEEVQRQVRSGANESTIMPLKDSLDNIKIMEKN